MFVCSVRRGIRLFHRSPHPVKRSQPHRDRKRFPNRNEIFWVYHSPRNFYKLIPLPVFFLYFFCNFYGHRFPLRRGYCTKTKQEWPDSGSTLENIFCNFYEINSSQDFFCIAKILVLMVWPQIQIPTVYRHHKRLRIKNGIQRGWCTNRQNIREQQNVYHPQD